MKNYLQYKLITGTEAQTVEGSRFKGKCKKQTTRKSLSVQVSTTVELPKSWSVVRCQLYCSEKLFTTQINNEISIIKELVVTIQRMVQVRLFRSSDGES